MKQLFFTFFISSIDFIFIELFKMGDPLPKLHAIELAFHSLIFEFYEDYPEFSKDFILEFIQRTGEYSKELNLSLKTYAKIEYFKNKNAKIAMKA